MLKKNFPNAKNFVHIWRYRFHYIFMQFLICVVLDCTLQLIASPSPLRWIFDCLAKFSSLFGLLFTDAL